MPEELKTVIYRVPPAALGNIVKRSKADHVLLCHKEHGGSVQLAIEEDGRGFDLEDALSVEASERGFGLGSMKERTELSGGSLTIESTVGSGTVVRASWPIDE
ncbi:MAG: hypothetical protein JSU72_07375 [Deltaproteobacteria bacterium]|nr:MAG: hypothetical protein JSU72_07375 [Deltaproteobacteria bacterium]